MPHPHIPSCFKLHTLYMCGNFHIMNIDVPAVLVLPHSTHNTPCCTCKDWIQYKIPCKHFLAVFEHSEQWKWESLPKQYLESSHITADVKAFDNEYPTVSDTTPNKPLDLVCGTNHPPTPGSADFMPSYDQDHPPLTSTDTQEDSASAHIAVQLHITRYLQNIQLVILFH